LKITFTRWYRDTEEKSYNSAIYLDSAERVKTLRFIRFRVTGVRETQRRNERLEISPGLRGSRNFVNVSVRASIRSEIGQMCKSLEIIKTLSAVPARVDSPRGSSGGIIVPHVREIITGAR